MPVYRIYSMRDGHVYRGAYLEAADEAAAVDFVRRNGRHQHYEIWHGTRRVAELERADEDAETEGQPEP